MYIVRLCREKVVLWRDGWLRVGRWVGRHKQRSGKHTLTCQKNVPKNLSRRRSKGSYNSEPTQKSEVLPFLLLLVFFIMCNDILEVAQIGCNLAEGVT